MFLALLLRKALKLCNTPLLYIYFPALFFILGESFLKTPNHLTTQPPNISKNIILAFYP
jgi:hypothetical protein